MNVWQCIPCGSQLWQLSGRTVICAKCQSVSASLRLDVIPVEPSASTIEQRPAHNEQESPQ